MAARIQPQNIGPDATGPYQDPYKITGPIPADQIDPVREAYFKHQAATKPGNYDNDGNFAGVDPFDLQADGSYRANSWSMGHNSGSDRLVEIEDADGTKNRVESWKAQPLFYNALGLGNFDVLADRLETLQGSGLASIKDMVNQAYSKIG